MAPTAVAAKRGQTARTIQIGDRRSVWAVLEVNAQTQFRVHILWNAATSQDLWPFAVVGLHFSGSRLTTVPSVAAAQETAYARRVGMAHAVRSTTLLARAQLSGTAGPTASALVTWPLAMPRMKRTRQ